MSIQEDIARKLSSGPGWTRSFQASKSTLNAMIEADEVGRVKPIGGASYNMVALTATGSRKYLGKVIRRCAPTREQIMDRLASKVAGGLDVRSASRAVGIPPAHGLMLWDRIVADLGWQAV